MSRLIQLRLLQHRRGRLRSSLCLLARLIILTTVLVPVQDNLLAQAPQGVIRGVVNDVTGTVVTKVSLRVTQPQFGSSRVVTTDAYGQYYVTDLDPGDYEIEPFAPGFKTEVKHVTLRVGDRLTVNFQLRLGPLNKRVLVSGQTSGIN